MRIRLMMLVLAMICIVIASPAMAKDNPYRNAHKVTKADVPVDIEADTVKLSDTSGLVFDGAGYTHTIGRVSIRMKPLLKGLEEKPIVKGNKRTSGTGHTIQYELYKDLIKEQVTLNSHDTVGYSYDIRLSDWVTTEPDLSRPEVTMDANKTEIVLYPYTKQVTSYARDSTIDIDRDEWGNLVVTVNGADVVVIPKPFATDATGRRFELDFTLDKANKIITITGDMAGAQYPVTIDPTERVTNGGFESGSTAGWYTDSSPAATLTIMSGGANGGTYYCRYQGNWDMGIAGYSRIYQTIDYTGVTSASMAVKIFGYNIYDFVLSDGFWQEAAQGTRNYYINFPGQVATGWVTKSATPTLSGEHKIQFWTYGYNMAGIDSISATGTVTPPTPLTYSMTNVETFSGKMNLAPKGKYACDGVRSELSEWGPPKFYKRDTAVTKADFGSSGLTTSTFHYHYGHGDKLLFDTGIRLTNDWVQPGDVFRAWNGKNKWVLIDACNVLSDPNWGNAMVTTHSIMGFTNEKSAEYWWLPQVFLWKVKDGSMTVYDAYYTATKGVYQGTGARAAVLFHNQNQFENDHFPPGYVAPDGSPNDKLVYKTWEL